MNQQPAMPVGQQPAEPTPIQGQQGGQKQEWFNQEVQEVLFSRIQALAPEEVEILDTVVTEQTFPVLAKVFPELFHDGSMDASQQGQPQEYGAIPPQQPQQQEQNPLLNDSAEERPQRGLMR